MENNYCNSNTFNIGNKIKELRLKRNITQEKMANYIGISAQAISKWENGISLPDISQVPLIADFFGITTDELFNMSLIKRKENIEKIVDESYKYRSSDRIRSRQILLDGLERFPGDEVLLNCLLYTYALPDEVEKIISTSDELILNCESDDVKYDALRFKADAYRSIGKNELAKATIEKIPEIYFMVNELKAEYLEGEEKLSGALKHRNYCAASLIDMMIIISQYYKDTGKADEKKKNDEMLIKLFHTVSDIPYFFGNGESVRDVYEKKIEEIVH